jgi:serine/threonine protein phosphatase 1
MEEGGASHDLPFSFEMRYVTCSTIRFGGTMLTYAIGDIHGCAAKLEELLPRCEAHAAGSSKKLIFLGDYIDRGPASAAVIRILRTLQIEQPDSITCILGNHEDMLLAAFDDALFEENWLLNGGDKTLLSYGVSTVTDLPADDIGWLRSLPKSYDDGLRYFVHAGVHPDRALDHQNDFDLLWIKKPFLSSTKDFGRLVVHGHVPTASRLPEIHPNRLNLDTGAVFGGPLTADVLNDRSRDPLHFLSTA